VASVWKICNLLLEHDPFPKTGTHFSGIMLSASRAAQSLAGDDK
jgi:hypothetical protein